MQEYCVLWCIILAFVPLAMCPSGPLPDLNILNLLNYPERVSRVFYEGEVKIPCIVTLRATVH